VNPKNISPSSRSVALKKRASKRLVDFSDAEPGGEFLTPTVTFNSVLDPFNLRSGQAVRRFFCEIRQQRALDRRSWIDRES
jgi:hypothetical protein